MARSPTFVASILNPQAADGRSDTPGAARAQDQAWARRRTRTRTLILLRAAYIVGQVVMLLVTWRVLKWWLPAPPCIGLVSASVLMNLALAASSAAKREALSWEVDTQLVFDILQLASLLYFIGGAVNPFALMLVAPVTVAGGALPPRNALWICVLAVAAIVVLAQLAGPPTLASGAVGYGGDRLGCAVALVTGALFAGGYAIWSAAEEARMELALHVAETVLAREQRLSALGSLAAAVAHELGTPLATIAVTATELAREAPEGPLRDDAVLMVEQARRCRDILRRMAEAPEQSDALHERMSPAEFVEEIAEAWSGDGEIRVNSQFTGPPGMTAPDLRRRPEILHALSTVVENAVDFARSEIMVAAWFDADAFAVEVRDDGPGFDPGILPRLGEPYVTTRPAGEGSRTGHIGMGLGLFIAKTLLQRSGAEVSFANPPGGGARVTALWPRARVEMPAPAPDAL